VDHFYDSKTVNSQHYFNVEERRKLTMEDLDRLQFSLFEAAVAALY